MIFDNRKNLLHSPGFAVKLSLLKRSPRLVQFVRQVRGWSRAWILGQRPSVWNRALQRAVCPILAAPGACFVQVGSNDGRSGDPFYALIQSLPQCRGVFIEPVPALFARLRQNYAGERFTCVNAAIADEPGERDFFLVSPEGVARFQATYPWIEQIGSFRREHLTESYGGEFARYVISMKIAARRLDELLASLNLPRVDVLHIDTEGYDYRVLRTFDWKRYHPAAVIYEHQHLSTAERAAAENLLCGHGYRLRMPGGDDTLATAI